MDSLIKGLAFNEKIRVLAVDGSDTLKEICLNHKTLPLTTVVFSKFLLAALLIGALEKSNTGITLQINSSGPLSFMYAQATSRGDVRGYLSRNDGDLELDENNLSHEALIGINGILSVTKTNNKGQDFVSDVILAKSNITQDIASYFYTSEQVPTIINLQVDLDEEGLVKSGKGLMMQLLPGYDENDLNELEKIKDKMSRLMDLKEDINKCFNDFTLLETLPVKTVCNCNKERYLSSLNTLSKQDLQDIIKDNQDIEIVCEFCKKQYLIKPSEIKELIDNK